MGSFTHFDCAFVNKSIVVFADVNASLFVQILNIASGFVNKTYNYNQIAIQLAIETFRV